MERTTEAIVERRVGAALGTMLGAMKAQEAKLLAVERRLGRKLAQQEKGRAEAARKEEAAARHAGSMGRLKKMEQERAENKRFEGVAKAQRESEQRLLQAIKAAAK